jgi:uncharacterized protein (TIGR02453 family)
VAARVSRFPPEALAFLRALKRNNRREWFKPRKEKYDAVVRAPMIAIVERLAGDFRTFAPEFVASPTTSLYRIYRDTRFSEDKTPYKTHAAAIFPPRGLPKHQGAGLYFHVSPQEVWVGGGMYAPDASQLHAVREHIAENLKRLRRMIETPAFRREAGELEGERLQRVPRGFSKDDPAAPYLRYRQFIVGREFPPEFATSPRFYDAILTVFRRVAPFSRFLNEPMASLEPQTRKTAAR